MKGRPVDQLVFEQMFPKPRPADPQNFQALLQRHLILEVRQEVHSFYGHLDTPEAKYPGLDYCHPTHRVRLSRWQWHRRLFRAFDSLRLTPNEIAGLTKWEGTKWAKERYEQEHGVIIEDTAAEEFSNWVPPEERQYLRSAHEIAAQLRANNSREPADENMGEESDEELESVGVDLNERLRERVALRNVSGDITMPLDEEWEQWLKNAIDSGELRQVAEQIARISGSHNFLSADDIFPPRMVTAARNGNWHEIPSLLHDMIRSSLQSESRPSQSRTQQPAAASAATTPADPLTSFGNASSTAVTANSITQGYRLPLPTATLSRYSQEVATFRRTYSDLRLPVGDGGGGGGGGGGSTTNSTTDLSVQRTAGV